jgi:adenylate cyclase
MEKNKMKKEIEKKYLVNQFPHTEIENGELKFVSKKIIFQTYLGIGVNDESRVRRLEDVNTRAVDYTQTYKRDEPDGHPLEIEYEISESLYFSTVNDHMTKPLIKTRTTFEWNGFLIEMDEYNDFDFIVAEVEFEDKAQLEGFTPPHWCFEDISKDKQYKNKKLWKKIQ